MSAAYYVELLARNHELRQRYGFEQLPIRVGRAYDNDLILDDPHVAPHHALIDLNQEGQLEVSELQTRNGIMIERQRLTRVRLSGDTVFRIGHQRLRVRAANYAVAPEQEDTTFHGWEGWPPAITGIALVALLTLLSTWLGLSQKFTPTPFIQGLTPILAITLAWCGMWAFATQLLSGHARLGRHLFIVGITYLVMNVWVALSSVTAFAFSLEWLIRVQSYVSMSIIAAGLGFHFITVRPDRVQRAALIAGTTLALSIGTLMLGYHQNTGRYTDSLYMHLLLPPSLKVASDHPADQFFDQARSMKSTVDQLRANSPEAGATDGDE